jgi:hypothetical protein
MTEVCLKKKSRFAKVKLAALLYGLKTLMQLTALRNKKFKAKLREKNWVMQFKTADSSVGRHFTFHDGKISTGRGVHHKPDFSFVWRDENIGYRVMSHVTSKALINSITNGDLKLEGEASGVTWFLEVLKMMKRINKV